MQASTEEIKRKFEDLIEGKTSREDFSNWARERMIANDNDRLEYDPPKDEEKIWDGIMYLLMVDLLNLDGEYLYSIDDFIDYKNENF